MFHELIFEQAIHFKFFFVFFTYTSNKKKPRTEMRQNYAFLKRQIESCIIVILSRSSFIANCFVGFKMFG